MLGTDTVFNIGPGALTPGTTQLLTEGLASSSGVTLDHTTAGTLKVRNNANAADAALTASNLTLSGTLTYGGTALSSAVTGTGNLVLSASPSLSGTLALASATATGTMTVLSGTAVASGVATQAAILFSSTASFGVFFGAGAPSFSAAQGSLYLRSDGSATTNRGYINRDGAASWTAITTSA